MKIYFYPHVYLRDRHLETVRRWPKNEVVNSELALNRIGAQVNSTKAIRVDAKINWKQVLPLINIKARPKLTPKEAIVYVWGGIIAQGLFITDLDNPWSLVGYNTTAMTLYRHILRIILLSDRCLEIRCISEACRQSMYLLFGKRVYEKSVLHYPKLQHLPSNYKKSSRQASSSCKFLFIGTQFEIKGGRALISAFRHVVDQCPNAELTLITHLSQEYLSEIKNIKNLKIISANVPAVKIRQEYMFEADVLVHPSFMESFGMVMLEALSEGLAIISSDVYAAHEMVENDLNGFLIKPPISAWQGYLPTSSFLVPALIKNLSKIDLENYAQALAKAMITLSRDPQLLNNMKVNSRQLFQTRFSSKI